MKLVLDANVLVAAVVARGLCSELFKLCLERHEILLSTQLLQEVERTLLKKIKLPRTIVAEFLSLLEDQGSIVAPALVESRACRDKNDLHVLGLAQAGGATYIVTGDNDLLVKKRFKNTRIVTPRAFWVAMQLG